MVRLELLAYENPEGLHPIEKSWRDLCRKLVKHNEEMQDVAQRCIKKMSQWDREQMSKEFVPFKFPKAFTPAQPGLENQE